MSDENNERQQDSFDLHIQSPVHESTIIDVVVTRIQDDSFQSSSSSNSKSSSSTTSRSSRRQFLIIQHQSAVNSPLMYSRCTSLGSLASYDIRSSCNDSYASECSSIKPYGIISPSDIPDSPPYQPEIIEEEHEHIKHNNRTLTMNTTSSHNRTTMMGETVIEKTFIFNQYELISNQNNDNDNEHLDEVIVYSYDKSDINQNHINKSFVITEESSFIEDNLNSNDENNSIKILYDLIEKPHWTNKNNLIEQQLLTNASENPNTSFSSSLSLDNNSNNQTDDDDDDDEYHPEKGRQLIQRLIEETLTRRSLQTDFLHSTSCVLCPSNTPITIPHEVYHHHQVQYRRLRNLVHEKTVHHTRSSFLRLRQAQQNKLLYQ
ncbi:unnamed protein product [Rotaria sp. Silwood1]|nr:unnamed protein product [Rotaria sp. Silwood1]